MQLLIVDCYYDRQEGRDTRPGKPGTPQLCLCLCQWSWPYVCTTPSVILTIRIYNILCALEQLLDIRMRIFHSPEKRRGFPLILLWSGMFCPCSNVVCLLLTRCTLAQWSMLIFVCYVLMLHNHMMHMCSCTLLALNSLCAHCTSYFGQAHPRWGNPC